jgi:hypothetical protein
MKPANLALYSIALCLFVFSGCGKKEPPHNAPYDIGGVKVDIPKLQQMFSTTPDLQPPVNQAVSQLRYGRYLEAMKSLDQLANNPALNDSQKKAVNEVIEQMKQVINKLGESRQ